MIPLNWKLRLLPGYFGFPMPLSQQAEKGVIVLAGVTANGKLDYYSIMGVRKSRSGVQESP
jgi:hypothetical protein